MLKNDDLRKKAEVLAVRGQLQAAVQAYEKILKRDSSDTSAWIGMGLVFRQTGRIQEAQSCFTKAVQIDPGLARVHFHLGDLFREQGLFDAAERSFQEAVRTDPVDAQAYFQLGRMLNLQGRAEEAVAAYDKVLSLSDSIPEAYWNKLRTLPVIYDDEDQINLYRDRYADGLKVLSEGLSLDTAKDRLDALKGISTNSNFYLQYQGRNDKELQKQYGEIVHRIMAAVYPQWAAPLKPLPPVPNGKIRIGYASTFLRAHNGAVWLLGWLRGRDRENLEVYCYHTGTSTDAKTDEFKSCCDHFYHMPGDMEKACTQIAADKLHILVYPELGMDAFNVMMAGLRLAPVQCVGWGHPITSGLPTMDYWLSSDLMEPENGQEHYTETLVCLPNMAHCYSRAQHDRLQKQPPARKRADFKLRDDAVLYLCSQSLFKYLPKYDYLLPEIARQVPGAQFVFLAISSVHVVRRFMERLDNAFQSAGLRAQDYCTMLNRLPPDDYLALNQVADIFLDNPPWSGNNTTLVAVDCHLPVVTLPTEFMRGRHSYAIMNMLGITETIAGSEQEYVDIAVRLGNDKEWRREIVHKITDQHGRIYEDRSCVQALDEFYRGVVGKLSQARI